MLWTAFLFGLLSSGHCLVMCGPLVLAMQSGKKWHFLLYHSGRIFSYLSIGLLFGFLGKVISLTVFQQDISIISGIFLLIFAALFYLPFVKRRYGISRSQKLLGFLSSKLFQKLKAFPVLISITGRGMLNGFLPCGMVYLAASAALTGGTVSFGILYMLVFGLGTIPAMLSISFLGKMAGGLRNLRLRIIFSKAAPYFAVLIACLFILRGLSLDIPYLSPKIVISENHLTKSCCNKTELEMKRIK